MKVTPDIERLFRIAIEKHLLNKNAEKTTIAYRRFADLFEQYFPNISVSDRPTIRQFRYFYNREYKQSERLIARTAPEFIKKISARFQAPQQHMHLVPAVVMKLMPPLQISIWLMIKTVARLLGLC